jgi:signal peptidase II
MTMRAARLMLLLIALGVAGCDQGTKRWAETDLQGGDSITVIRGRLDLSYTENPGNAFRMDRALPEPVRVPVLIGAALAALGWLGVAWWRQRRAGAAAISGALIAGGAAGNLIDRAARGHVIDFIHWHGWPVFNVADIALVAGGALLVITALAARPRSDGSPPAAPSR